jgi:DNA-binding NarL/FixJ family response regulator
LSPESLRVVLAEGHPSLRTAVKNVLEEDGFVVCAVASTPEEGLRTVLRERPDICLVGFRMDLATLRMIASIADGDGDHGTVVIVLTESHSTESMVDAIRAGATGYLLKEMNPERIAAALRGVLDGEAAMPRVLVTRLIREIRRMGRGPMLDSGSGLIELTPRQWEVINLMADRLSTAEIAERLMVSPVTIRRHISAILGKLGVADREAALKLLRLSR